MLCALICCATLKYYMYCLLLLQVWQVVNVNIHCMQNNSTAIVGDTFVWVVPNVFGDANDNSDDER